MTSNLRPLASSAAAELGQVEPVRLHLPDQVLHLAVRKPFGTTFAQRSSEQPQILEQRVGCGVRKVRVTQPGRSDAARDKHQQLAMRLPVSRAHQLREQVGMREASELE